MEAPPAILVTGFEPFHSFRRNPSGELARHLDGTMVGGMPVVGRVLPVAARELPGVLASLVDDVRPAIVLALGLSRRAVLSMERVAINVLDFRLPDSGGLQPRDAPIVADGPAAYLATLPVRHTVETWRRHGVPGEVSYTAGTFCCNQAMYLLLRLAAGAGRLAGFVHVPPLPEQVAELDVEPGPSVAWELQLRGVELALEVAAEAWSGGVRPAGSATG